MPFGSSARFRVRINAYSTGSARAANSPRPQAADAVFGADAAAETFDQIEHRRFERFAAREKLRARCIGALTHVEMQVAVAHMAVATTVDPRGPAAG